MIDEPPKTIHILYGAGTRRDWGAKVHICAVGMLTRAATSQEPVFYKFANKQFEDEVWRVLESMGFANKPTTATGRGDE